MPSPSYIPDFYVRADEDGEAHLRCRPCNHVQVKPVEWVNERIGGRVPCPGCGLVSRLPVNPEDA